MGENREEEIDMYSEIKRLIDEKCFTQERLIKALNYYESESIDLLPEEAAKHFLQQLIKL